MPVLDNQLKTASPLVLPKRESSTPLLEAEAVDLIKDTFASAVERDIYIGDRVQILVINKDGTRTEFMELKKD